MSLTAKSTGSKHPLYFEAIIQLRPFNQEIYNLIVNLMKKYPLVWISREEELKTGIDIYISSQKFARGTVVSQVRKAFKKTVIKVTRSQFSRDKDTGRTIYRATVLIKS